uniref:Calcineurin B-like protein n=1 Tax=Oryza sativa subsp. japonica TaxID=39947 RepID=Q6K5R0_ORYSJ|nr:hypothetical protein [Oryza sativa Japonica Group]BAD22065.1 hypothetical protein [Oryza sativa Japonica Group]
MAGLVMSCCNPIPNVTNDGAGNPEALAAQTIYTVNEIEALYELFKRIDGAVIEDGKINMEEFNLRVFGPEKGGTCLLIRRPSLAKLVDIYLMGV